LGSLNACELAEPKLSYFLVISAIVFGLKILSWFSRYLSVLGLEMSASPVMSLLLAFMDSDVDKLLDLSLAEVLFVD